MLTDLPEPEWLIAHLDPATPDDVWSRWNADPPVVLALVAISLLYRYGSRPSDDPMRRRAFGLGIGVVAVALLSPVDAAADALASAHMVQHLLLAMVAAPLLVFARPGPALTRALPHTPSRRIHRWTRRLSLAGRSSPLRRPGAVLVVVTGVFWFWHAPVVYEVTLRSSPAHAMSHTAYLGAGLLLWRAVRDAGRARGNVGGAVGLLFAIGLQGTLLSALMTFSDEPWYDPYVTTATDWGMDPLTDQQLAALIMWFPSALAYLFAALWVLRSWLVEPAPPPPPVSDRCPSPGSALRGAVFPGGKQP